MRIATLLFTMSLSSVVLAHPESHLATSAGFSAGLVHALAAPDHWLIWIGLGALVGMLLFGQRLSRKWQASIAMVAAAYLVLHTLMTPVLAQSGAYLAGTLSASALLMAMGAAIASGIRRLTRN